MTENILITGGTGVLGRHVVDRLARAGLPARVLSRTRGPHIGDLTTGAGLGPALGGVNTVIHLASDPRDSSADVEAARRLIAATPPEAHLVYISIVGVDRHPYTYYRHKHEVEKLIEDSGLPYTILRTTQFHNLVVLKLVKLAKSKVMPVPAGTDVQPVEVTEVAERMVELALGAPAGRVPDMGGPEIVSAAEAARTYLRVTGRRGLVMPLPVPGRVAAAFRRGVHLAPDHPDGRGTFADFVSAAAGRSGYEAGSEGR
ncbi:SDR family oxidoreductase [Streptosporangium amethystogenes subsp. fukuiense]|uniref:SDR family oxidoreductase n=1 Tax=Streptosporangium amethystogenes subsp. fukuiense TaxID=698418 RepID=A0ABW2TEL8_9ACTN